ncbi:MAG: usg protein [Candidatus Nucleicultricaceae bacterium]
MKEMSLLLEGYRLTTAEIIYQIPDYPLLLQSYTWQEYDLAPNFPELKKFLLFWQRSLEGKIHSVQVTSCALLSPAEYRMYAHNFSLH